MYKVLVVDDRMDVVEGIIDLVNWGQLDCQIVGWATNGETACEMIERNVPDIVITDIKMPVMDGLKLVEVCKERWRNIRFVILSGYDDFSFAQRALRLGVDEYLLKPASVESITSTIKRLADDLNIARDENEKIYFLKRQLRQGLPLMKAEYFRHLVSETANLTMAEIVERFSFLSVDIELENLTIVVIELDHNLELIKEHGQAVVDSFYYAIANGAEELLSESYKSHVFRYGGSKTVVLLNCNIHDAMSKKHLRLTLEDLSEKFIKGLLLSITIGISNTIESILEIKEAFAQAIQSVSYKLYLGHNHVIFYDEINKASKLEQVNYMNIQNQLIHTIRTEEREERSRLIKEFIKRNQTLLPEQLKRAVQEITMVVCHYADHTERAERIVIRRNLIEESDGLQTAEELEHWMNDILDELCDRLQKNRVSQLKHYGESAKSIVEIHYANNITLAGVSEIIGLAPTYLSAIFKEEAGMTFTEYLIEVRIKKAKELLKTKSYKVYQIAEKVGYSDSRYFSEVFKKKVGVTPKEYISQD